MEPSYLCALYVATAGQQGHDLGKDETEIVLLIYVMIDMQKNKIVGYMQHRVKPYDADRKKALLSKDVLEESTLTEKLVRFGVPLSTAIAEFERYRSRFQIEPSKRTLHFLTDGQLHLRQCLYPEARRKNMKLSQYYTEFHDLRKEFKAFYGLQDEPQSIRDMIRYLGMTPTEYSVYFFKEVDDMLAIAKRLIAYGHKFTSPEAVNLRLELGIYLREEEVDDSCVVKVSGLPVNCSPKEVANFFIGLNVAKGGIAICKTLPDCKYGIAYVMFESQQHRNMALGRHLHRFGDTYIEVYKASGQDFLRHAAGNNTEAQAFLSRGGQLLVKLRGLPYDCTAEQVLKFFKAGEKSSQVMNGKDGVLLVKTPNGKTTGLAFVLFAREEDATKVFSKHNSFLCYHDVEITRSSPQDLQYVLNAFTHLKNDEGYESPGAQTPSSSGAQNNILLLRGLPFNANENTVWHFLGDHAKNAFSGITFFYSGSGFSKQAVIQMHSEQSAFIAAQATDLKCLEFGIHYWYIGVYQCSREDIAQCVVAADSSAFGTQPYVTHY